MDDKTRGLYAKYAVERADGKSVGPCFVLELKDSNTWAALGVWANVLENQGYIQLAKDIRAQIRRARNP